MASRSNCRACVACSGLMPGMYASLPGCEIPGSLGLAAPRSGPTVARRPNEEANVRTNQSTVESRLTGFAGELISAGDPSYESARRVFNAQVDCRPELIARCATTADVTAAVRHAREWGLELSVRSGGHSLAGWSVADGALTLDVSALKTIEVDPVRQRVRAGAGVKSSTRRRRGTAWPRPAHPSPRRASSGSRSAAAPAGSGASSG